MKNVIATIKTQNTLAAAFIDQVRGENKLKTKGESIQSTQNADVRDNSAALTIEAFNLIQSAIIDFKTLGKARSAAQTKTMKELQQCRSKLQTQLARFRHDDDDKESCEPLEFVKDENDMATAVQPKEVGEVDLDKALYDAVIAALKEAKVTDKVAAVTLATAKADFYAAVKAALAAMEA